MMADPAANKLLPTMQRMWHDGGLRGLFRYKVQWCTHTARPHHQAGATA